MDLQEWTDSDLWDSKAHIQYYHVQITDDEPRLDLKLLFLIGQERWQSPTMD